jgi:hypothetical protein
MKHTTLTASLFALLLCSCSHYYYVAGVQNVPLLREKDEFHLSGFIGGWDESSCIELQSAYSVTDKVGIMADFMTAWGGDVSENDYGKGSYFDGAVGYFKSIKESGVFEIYGGLGISSQHHEYSKLHYDSGSGNLYRENHGNSRLSFLNLFIQPSIGFKFSIFEAAVSTRICRVSYPKIENYITGNDQLRNELYEIGNKTHYFIEPAFTIRGGWKNFKVQAQIAYTGYMNKPKLYFYEEAHLSGGLYFNIPVTRLQTN